MNKRAGVQFAIVSWALACLPATATVAQSTQKVGGSWFTNEERIGLVLEKDGLHPYFMYGECERPRRQVRLNLEIEPKLFGDAVAREQYIIVWWSNGTSKIDSAVEAILLNEAGPYGWSPSLTVGLATVNFWLHAPQLEFTIGVREDGVFKPRQTYLLPNENRQAALSSFIRFCFGDASPAPR
jgi:hypothetical protein